jgi:hypothetical protein
MSRALAAGAAYALCLLAAGTVLGTLRVLFATPRVGPGWALALELPVMLAIAWAAAGWLLAKLAVPSRPAPRLAMSAAALVLLFAGEAALAASLTGTRPLAWLEGFASPASWPGLAAQLLACSLPLLRRRAH